MKKLILTGALALFTASLSLAQNVANIQAQLLAQQERPTVEQLVSLLGSKMKPNPFQLVDYNLVGGSLLQAYQNDFPRVVAQLEKVYPGALFLGLGRDSALMVDALDAFYQNFGQKGRARMIEASGNSFVNRPTNEELVKFLENYGLDLNNIEKSRPVVIFDGTRFNPNSQSRLIMTALYEVAASRGLDVKALVRKLNFVSMAYNGYKYYPQNWIYNTSSEQYFANEERTVTRTGPNQILSVDGWYLTHGYNWTNTFGPFRQVGGKMVTTPGQAMSQQERLYVIGNQVEIINIVQSEQTQRMIVQEATKLGYNFNDNLRLYLTKTAQGKTPNIAEPIVLKPEDIDKNFIKEIEANLKGIPKFESAKDYKKRQIGKDKVKLSDGGYAIWTEFTKAANIQAPNYFEIAFASLVKFYKNKFIGARDFRRILISILDAKPINASFVAEVQKQYKDVLPVEAFLGQEDIREKYLKEKGVAGQNYSALVDNGKLPLSCRYAYSGLKKAKTKQAEAEE